MKSLFFYIVACLLLVPFAWIGYEIWYFHQHSYSYILQDHLTTCPAIYEGQLFGKQLFTELTFHESWYWLWIGFFFNLFFNCFWWHQKSKVEMKMQGAIMEIRHLMVVARYAWQLHTHVQKGLFFTALSFIALHQVYIYKETFVAMDEAFSWLYFASQGIKVTLTHYPVPNNHVLYNLGSSFWAIFITDNVLAMRMTSILSFWALLGLLYVYLYYKYNFSSAFLSVLLVGLGFSQSIFSVQGRGYMLYTFCFLLALFSLIQYLEKSELGKPKPFYMYLFGIACVLGFATVPVFLYVMLSFCAYIFWEIRRKEYFINILKSFLSVGLLIISGSYLFYLPILVYSGIGAFLGNESVSTSVDANTFFFQNLFINIRESIIYIFGLPKYISFCLALGMFIFGNYLYFTKQFGSLHDLFRRFWTFLIISLLITLGVMSMMRVFPHYRVWTYYSIFILILLSVMLAQWFKSHTNLKLAILMLGLFTGSFPQFWREIKDLYTPEAYQYHKTLEKETKRLMAAKKHIFTSKDAFYIQFWAKYTGNEYLLSKDSCKAEVIVQEIFAEPPPFCFAGEYTLQRRDIWFLRFYAQK